MPVPGSSTLRQRILLLFALVGVMWLLEALDILTGHRLPIDEFGIRPRELRGLLSIPVMPFLHGSFQHLSANTFPFIILGSLVLVTGRATFVVVSSIVLFIGGLGTWVFGLSNTNHIGASGLIFGYLGFVLMRAWFDRKVGYLLMAAFAPFLYGGLAIGLMRTTDGVSWTGHFFGFVGGVVAAWLMRPRFEQKRPKSL